MGTVSSKSFKRQYNKILGTFSCSLLKNGSFLYILKNHNTTMNLLSVILATLTCMAVPALGQTDLRAQAFITLQDCLCQCSSYTFVVRGRTYGNCLASDQTGANWCYIEPLRNLYNLLRNSNRGRNYAFAQAPLSTTCPDAAQSRRFRNRQFSYNACATPRLDSQVCQRLVNQYYGSNNNGFGNNNNNNGFGNNNNGFGSNNNNNNNGFGNNNNNNYNRPLYTFGSTRIAATLDEGASSSSNKDSDVITFGSSPSSPADNSDDGAVVFK